MRFTIDLSHNVGQIEYSSVLVLISLTSLARKKKICLKTRTEGLINKNTKECKDGRY